jgi:Zn-finger nucleic acid-binding protein
MICPKCGSFFETVTFQSIEVERCTSCKGLWFDSQEEQKLRELRGSEQIDTGDPGVGKKFNEVANIRCPKCQAKMIRMVDSKQNHIWYESCPVCYGVFFDAGEFADLKQVTLFDWFRDWFTKERK